MSALESPECRCVNCEWGKSPCRASEQVTILTVVEPVPAGHNSLPRDLAPGEVIYRFHGPTYGVIGPDEVAISLAGSLQFPFHGVPRSAVIG